MKLRITVKSIGIKSINYKRLVYETNPFRSNNEMLVKHLSYIINVHIFTSFVSLEIYFYRVWKIGTRKVIIISDPGAFPPRNVLGRAIDRCRDFVESATSVPRIL